MIINSKIFNIPSSDVKPELTEQTKLIVISAMLTESEAELLQKMIAATGLNDSEVIHIITDNSNISVKYFTKHTNRLKIISFNTPADKLSLQVHVKKYQLFSIQNLDIVLVDDLASIGEQLNLKKYIWNVLKSWFVNEK